MRRVIAVIAVILIAVCLNSCAGLAVLGNINMLCAEQETSTSAVTFDAKAGDTLKFSFHTEAKNGTVDFVLTNSDGEIAAEFDRAKAMETYVDLSRDDTYILTAYYKNFKGSFSAKVESEG